MKIFITGATGFLGKHMLDKINKLDFNIMALSRINNHLEYERQNKCQWLIGDLSDLNSIKKQILHFDPDVVIHLAWQDIPNYSNSISKINLMNSIQLFDLIIDNTNCNKIIISGSCYEYGKMFGECSENDAIILNSYFSWAKVSLYKYLLLKMENTNISLLWFRIFYVYGFGQRSDSLIPSIIESYKNSLIPVINSPDNKNDFIHVDDVIDALIKAIKKDCVSGIYNIGNGKSESVYDVCKIIEENMPIVSNLSYEKNNSSKMSEIDFWANIEKVKKALNWEPKIGIKKGIIKSI